MNIVIISDVRSVVVSGRNGTVESATPHHVSWCLENDAGVPARPETLLRARRRRDSSAGSAPTQNITRQAKSGAC